MGPRGRPALAADEARRAFDDALADDLNTPEALAAVHGLVSRANALLAEGALTRAGAARVRAEIVAMDGVFGVLLPVAEEDRLSPDEQALFDERQDARRKRDFARADDARKRLEEVGRRARGHAQGHALAPEALSRWREPETSRPGRSGEDLAADYLRRKGMAILARNYRCRAGEIDIVAREAEVVVFVEVKERTQRVARDGGRGRHLAQAAEDRAGGPGLRRRTPAGGRSRPLRRRGDRLGAFGPARAARRGGLRRGLRPRGRAGRSHATRTLAGSDRGADCGGRAAKTGAFDLYADRD